MPPRSSSRRPRAAGPSGPRPPLEEREPVRRRGPLLFLAILGLLILAVGAALAWNPVQRGRALAALDAARSGGPEAWEDPARRFLALARGDPDLVAAAVDAERGPREAQIWLAQEARLLDRLRRLADSREASATQARLALVGFSAVFRVTKPRSEALPERCETWAASRPGATAPAAELGRSLAAIELLACAGREGAPRLLARIAGEDEVRAGAALDGLAAMAGAGLRPATREAVALLSTPVAERVLRHRALADAIVATATAEDLPALCARLADPQPAVRALACAAIAGPEVRLIEGPAAQSLRVQAEAVVRPLLVPGTGPEILAGALRATRRLRLAGTREALLALVPALGRLAPQGIDAAFLGLTLQEACLPSSLDTGDAAALGRAGETVDLLAAGLADRGLRPVAAAALGGIVNTTYVRLPQYRAALDRLAAGADDPVCLAALAASLPRVYQRPDLAASCGRDPGRWRAFLTRDRQRLDALHRHQAWLHEHSASIMRVSDGKERLTQAKAYLAQAQAELDGWLAERPFSPPLGVARKEVDDLALLVRQIAREVRNNLVGAH